MAAVLALGPDAVLSHRTAAGLWGLRPNSRPTVELSVRRAGVRGRPGIDVHRRLTLTSADLTRVDNMPCTTVARTLVDLGDVTSRRVVEYAAEQAEVLRLFDLQAIEEVLGRTSPTRGTKLLSAVLEELSGHTLTASGLEEAFLAICRRAGVPDPEVNAWMTLADGTPAKIDFLWREQRIAVETDGGPFHRTQQSRERDARRDQLLRLAGFEPLRFTDRQVALERGWVEHTLRELIGRWQPLASRADGERSGRAGAQAA